MNNEVDNVTVYCAEHQILTFFKFSYDSSLLKKSEGA